MVLDPATMAATMVARAVSQGLVDAPPHFALSRVYSVIARGVVETLLEQTSTIVTVLYTGQPAIGFGTATAVGVTGLDGARYGTTCQNLAGYFGPFAGGFFFGLGGVADHISAAVQLTDLLVPTGNGTGLLSPGGLLLNPDDCFDNMKSQAAAEGIMVVKLKTVPDDGTGHLDDPLGSIEDPITSEDLFLGDLFTRAEILLQAVANGLAAELLFATRAGIPVVGAFNPVDPIIAAPTITTLLT